MRPWRVALYARVSTADKGQDVELQLAPMRDYCARREWVIAGEYVDHASAADQRRRTEWRRLLAGASLREVDQILVWRIDRAFRSTLDALSTLRELDHRGVMFAALAQPELDTGSPMGRLLLTMLAAFAELERELIGVRTREGMAAAAKRGTKLGRPQATKRRRVDVGWRAIAPKVVAGEISIADAAKRLNVSRATVRELIRNQTGGSK